ncbi:MAG: SsrA-binding protein SmpB [Rhodobacteraceae bacterium]|nr:SsrA-binding protein SmpB [Paracoccaceae bacterium]
MAPRNKSDPNNKTIAENRKARYNYSIEDTLECGIMLEGSEVKALRVGGVNIAESYASIEDGELWLINSHVPKYEQARTFQHDERRRRKLLVSKRELGNLWKNIGRQGMTLVPLKMYFNDKGRAKLLIGIAKGKKAQDKRATEKKRDWQKQQGRILRDRG